MCCRSNKKQFYRLYYKNPNNRLAINSVYIKEYNLLLNYLLYLFKKNLYKMTISNHMTILFTQVLKIDSFTLYISDRIIVCVCVSIPNFILSGWNIFCITAPKNKSLNAFFSKQQALRWLSIELWWRYNTSTIFTFRIFLSDSGYFKKKTIFCDEG